MSDIKLFRIGTGTVDELTGTIDTIVRATQLVDVSRGGHFKPPRAPRYEVAEITRWTTLVPMPMVRPILRIPIPVALSSRMRASTEGFTGRRPSFVPFALARARPALTLSRMMPRSNSANTPSIWNIALPAVLDVSSPC